MNILVVHGSQIALYPPVRNLVNVLLKKGHRVTLITRNDAGMKIAENKNLKCIVLPKYKLKYPLSLFSYINRWRLMRKLVHQEMQNNDILWTTTDETVQALGKTVLNYKHIMQLMELVEDISAFPFVPLLKTNLGAYARKAYKVVVVEYNRAHIQKVWWDLQKLPSVLPNKPADEVVDRTYMPDNVKTALEQLDNEKRRLILYQGVFSCDRDLDSFIDAVGDISDDYCLLLMGRATTGHEEYLKKICREHDYIMYIPFVLPPYHLMITERAVQGRSLNGGLLNRYVKAA